jgi:hypothetical protein
MTALLNGLLADQALTALVMGLVVLTLADWITGVSAAVRSGTFEAGLIAAFVQTHVLGRVVPIAAVAVLGHFEPALWALAGLSAGAYTVETIASIRGNLMLTDRVATFGSGSSGLA